MFGNADLINELRRFRYKSRKAEDLIVTEAKKILKQDLMADKKILQHLNLYQSSFAALDEEDLDAAQIFTIAEIKKIAVLYRLKFLSDAFFKEEIPYAAELKIKSLNEQFRKEIREVFILAPYQSFREKGSGNSALLFVKTNYDNYYLLHTWGKSLRKTRKLQFLPLRSFETLVITVILATLLIDVSLPTRLITLDHTAGYWSGYRAAAFFHLLIFNFGVTAYLTFAFAKNFSSSVWNRHKDF